MKEQVKIPTGKVRRATRFLATGAKVGGNYVKHYTKKVLTGDSDETDLHQSNAEDIFESLSELKGSVLKVAQMLSLDKQALPVEYLRKFSEAHYQTPPLSYPLVVRTFRQELGCSPSDFFDTFSKNAVNAASIGQVHRATKEGKTLAVKIQYPGVAQSVSSDLKMAYPIAKTLFKMNPQDLQQYMKEVEEKLLEETDYQLELERSIDLSQRCAHLDNLVFPTYYPQWSSKRIITMDWQPGCHLEEWLEKSADQETRNRIGQTLWDFYQYQIHHLRQLHADPHPGNFIVRDNGQVAVIDFGCIKELPEDFYHSYFKLLDPQQLNHPNLRESLFLELGFLHQDDEPQHREFFERTFTESIELLGRPFFQEYFDFSDSGYFEEIYEMGSELSKAPQMRNSKHGRGSRHGLYLNRTYFGLYYLLHHLGAKVQTQRFLPGNS
ncbi:MAG: AarF/UbiB family protein [Cyclobacteriaceae bacterium]|nr:AarF/UbiB family protein [Cyclobacteriaceae bacterium]